MDPRCVQIVVADLSKIGDWVHERGCRLREPYQGCAGDGNAEEG